MASLTSELQLVGFAFCAFIVVAGSVFETLRARHGWEAR